MVFVWRLMQAASARQGPHWRLVVTIVNFLCTLGLGGAVAIGLGDGNEFDNVGCSTAQKPVPACRRVQYAKTRGFGIRRTPGAGVGPAGFSVEEDQGPKRSEAVPDCAYRLPGGMCKRSRQRCCLLPAAEPAIPIKNSKLKIQNSCGTQLPVGEKEPPIPFGDVMRMVQGFGGKLDAMMAEGRAWVEKIGRDIEAVARNQSDLRKENEVLRRENAALAKMQAEGLLTFVQKIDAESFQQGVTVLVHGDVSKAARALGLSDSTLRSRMARWPKRGKAYAALAEVVRWRKAIKGEAGAAIAKRVASGVEREVDYPALLRDVIEELGMLDPENWEGRTASLAETLRRAVES
jgi:hypothetical protein